MIPEFMRRVEVACGNCGAAIMRTVGIVARVEKQGQMFFCEDCWPDRARELGRAKYDRVKNDPAFRRRRRAIDKKYLDKRRTEQEA